jgi:hypothetical protein
MQTTRVEVPTLDGMDSKSGPVDSKAFSVDGSQIVDPTTEGELIHIDSKAERRLLWKFDLRILPLLAFGKY